MQRNFTRLLVLGIIQFSWVTLTQCCTCEPEDLVSKYCRAKVVAKIQIAKPLKPPAVKGLKGFWIALVESYAGTQEGYDALNKGELYTPKSSCNVKLKPGETYYMVLTILRKSNFGDDRLVINRCDFIKTASELESDNDPENSEILKGIKGDYSKNCQKLGPGGDVDTTTAVDRKDGSDNTDQS